MTPPLRAALGLSVGLHAAWLAGVPLASPVRFDVERGPSSVELYLAPPPEAARAPVAEPPPAPPLPEPAAAPAPDVEPVPVPVASEERSGALTDALPDYLRNPPPAYPRLAREQGWEGTVVLDVDVLPSGRCGAIEVLSTSGYRVLDEAAIAAVRRWVFRPARQWFRPIAFRVEIPITFRLIDAFAGPASP